MALHPPANTIASVFDAVSSVLRGLVRFDARAAMAEMR
jgi:hypothetical protein